MSVVVTHFHPDHFELPAFAMGETLSHLNHVMHRGEFRRERGGDGVYPFPLRARIGDRIKATWGTAK